MTSLQYSYSTVWLIIMRNELITFDFLLDNVDKCSEPCIYTLLRLYRNDFKVEKDRLLNAHIRKEFMKIDGIASELAEYVCNPPRPRIDEPENEYEIRMMRFFDRMSYLGFETYL